MKPIHALALIALSASAAIAPAPVSMVEAKVRLAEVTLKRSSFQTGHARTDLRIVPKAGKLTLVSDVKRLRLVLGVELRGGGKIRRVTLTLPRAFGGGRQTLFSNKSGGPSVQVDFRLRTGTALHNYVGSRGFTLCRKGGRSVVTVTIPVGVAIQARNGRNRQFRVRRLVPILVACPVRQPSVTVGDKLGNEGRIVTPRRSRSPMTKTRENPRVDGPVTDQISQRPQGVPNPPPVRKTPTAGDHPSNATEGSTPPEQST